MIVTKFHTSQLTQNLEREREGRLKEKQPTSSSCDVKERPASSSCDVKEQQQFGEEERLNSGRKGAARGRLSGGGASAR